MVEAGIEVVGPTEHENRDLVVVLDLVEDRAAFVLQVLIKALERIEALLHCEVTLVLGDAKGLPKRFEHRAL